jgi:large subunit ribosomal protein L13
MAAWKIVDARDQILGRMCSQVAKRALLGERIVIINAQNAIVSGNRNAIVERYVHLRHIRDHANPTHGPFHSSRPDTFIRQKIRYMLPKRPRGRDALRRVHVYISGIPKVKEEAYKNAEKMDIKNASVQHLHGKFMTVREICDQMGWTQNRGEISQ